MTVQGQRVTYSYDGDGMMVARTTGGSTTRFYLDGQRVINEGDGAGAITAAMFRGAGLSLGRQVGTAPTAYYLYNAHGDVVGVANSAGDQLATYEYDAFGVLTASTGSFDNPYRYAGEYFDYTTGQYYLRARFYSPRTGRFISQDTVLGEYNDPLSLHLYTYVESNPLTRVDPSGHAFACTQTCDTAEGGNLEPTTPQLMEQLLLSAGFTQKAIDHYGTGQLGQVLDVYQGDPRQLKPAVDELNTAAQRIADGSAAQDERAINFGLGAAGVFLVPAAAVVAPEVVVAAAASPETVAGLTWLASNGEDTVNAVVNCLGGPSPECAVALAPLAVPGEQTTAQQQQSVPTKGLAPNPNGKKGGPEHQAMNAQVESALTTQYKTEIANGQVVVRTEARVKIPTGGNKAARDIDVAVIDRKTGQILEAHQTGLVTKSFIPVPRERAAMAELEKAGVTNIWYHPYGVRAQ